MSAVTVSEKKLLTFGLKLLNVAGLNPNQNNVFAKMRTFIGSTMIFCCCTLATTEFLHQTNMIEAFHDIGEPIIASYQSGMKILSLLTTRHQLQILISKIYQFKNIQQLDCKLRDDLQAIEERIGKVFKLYCWSFCGAGFALSLTPLVSQNKGMPFPMYNFINLKKSPEYEIAFSWGCITYAYIVLLIAGWDIMFYSIVTYLYCELKIIKHEFQNLKISEKDVQSKFVKIVRHHEFVLSCIPHLNSVCSTALIGQFSSLMAGSCASLFMLSEGSAFPILFQQTLYLTAALGQLFFASFAGTLLTEQSQSVAMMIFHAPFWLEAPIEIKKRIIMVIQRSQKYEGLSMGGMWNIDLQLFTTVLKLSVTFLNAIVALKD